MKQLPLFRSLAAVAFLLAAALTLWAATGIDTTQQAPFPEIIVVNSTGDGDDAFPGDGQCETAVGNGVCTLRAAIEEANTHAGGDGIFFSIPTSDPGCDPASGVCIVSLFNSLPDITDSVNISGPGANKLFIDGSGDERFPTRVFNVTTSGTVSFSGITIAFGFTTGAQYGAGIQNVNGGTVNITNCTLSSNQVRVGLNNSDGGGAAIYNASNGTVNIISSTLRLNLADTDGLDVRGGAVLNKTGTIHVSNSTFDHNQSSSNGGAIWNDAGNVTVTGSTFYGNGGEIGGGIGSVGGTVSISNSTFHANIAYAFNRGVGGAIVNYKKSVLNLTNSTVMGNFSNYAGSGVYNDNTFGAIANVKSTIIAFNYLGTSGSGAAPDVYGPFNSAGFNLIAKKDGSTGFTAATDKKGTIAAPLNPQLDPKGLRNNGGPTQTVALVKGSPAIDKGTSSGLTGTVTTDQRGFARKVDNSSIPNPPGGDGTDIGAFELGAQ
jgi:CSLREA domain-containing protein